MHRRSRRIARRLAFAALLVSAGALAQPPKAPAKGHGTIARRGAVPGGAAPAQYTQAMVGWHAPTAGQSATLDASGRPMLVFKTLNHNETVAVAAAGERGGFAASDLDKIAHVLRSASGDEHPMDPRTIDILYRIQAHFGAQEIRVVSGYRVPKPNNHSNHGKGRAIDFILPGVPDVEVAKFAREIGFVGVGIYPTSQFVHVDIRPRSYFWVDYSGPGKRNRERGIMGDLALKSDQAALARGERPIEPFGVAPDVDAALRAMAPLPTPPDEDDDDSDG
jgi:uncharacterized protein YcbK (DUF882 family)